jgi:hypothetical protein
MEFVPGCRERRGDVTEKPAKLALEDGTVYTGWSFGAEGETCGEVVFNTSMTGYQEVLTDPSYKGQIVTMTYPLIGNYGVTVEDGESGRPQVEGFVVREAARVPSNYRSQMTWPEYLQSNVDARDRGHRHPRPGSQAAGPGQHEWRAVHGGPRRPVAGPQGAQFPFHRGSGSGSRGHPGQELHLECGFFQSPGVLSARASADAPRSGAAQARRPASGSGP